MTCGREIGHVAGVVQNRVARKNLEGGARATLCPHYAERLRALVERCTEGAGPNAGESLTTLTRSWLRFHGWWRKPTTPPLASAAELDQVVCWMRDERRLTPRTVEP